MLEKIEIMLDPFVDDPDYPDRDRGVPITPVRSHPTDAGLDLYAPYFTQLRPRSHKLINLGVRINIPTGYGGTIESRSGMNLRGINCWGRIDSGYTGPIKVNLFNDSDETFTIYPGNRIAQLVIHPIETPELVVVEEFSDAASDRGDSGFGSTGK